MSKFIAQSFYDEVVAENDKLRAQLAQLEGAYGAMAVEYEHLKAKLTAPPSVGEIEIIARDLANTYFEWNILDRGGYKRQEYIDKHWKKYIHQAKAAITKLLEMRS